VGSAIPAVVDYLKGLADTVATASSSEVIVTDGWPTLLGHTMFGIGVDRPPDLSSGQAADGPVAVLTLGNATLVEQFAVPCYIYRGAGGTDQKACRDAVFAVFDPFIEQLRADLLAQPSAVPCLTAMVSNVALEGPKSEDEAAKGRYALLAFTVMCRNLY